MVKIKFLEEHVFAAYRVNPGDSGTMTTLPSTTPGEFEFMVAYDNIHRRPWLVLPSEIEIID